MRHPTPIVGRAPYDRDAMTEQALGHIQAGLVLLDASRPHMALDEFTQAAAIDPTIALAHAGASWALVDLRRYDEARSRAEMALEIDPGLAMAHVGLGRAMAAVRGFRRAIAAVREAIRLQPYNAGYYSVLSMILLRSGRRAEAETVARDGLQVDPGSIECLNNLAASLIDQGRIDEARPILLEALRLDPNAAVLHANLGTTQLHAGERDAADETIRELLRLDPQSTQTVEMLRTVETTRGPLDRFFFRLGFWWRRQHPIVRIGAALISLLGGYLTLGFAIYFWVMLLRDGWGWLDRQLELSYRFRALRVLGAIVPRTLFGGTLACIWVIVAWILAIASPAALIPITAAMAGLHAVAESFVGRYNKAGLAFLIWFAGVVASGYIVFVWLEPFLPAIPGQVAVAISIAIAALIRLRTPILVRLGWRLPPIPVETERW